MCGYRLLALEPYHPSVLTMQAACFYELGEADQLYLLGNELMEHFEDRPSTWFTLGCYYFLTGNNTEARRHFR
jgi:anaphase-promoting complex subunit 6